MCAFKKNKSWFHFHFNVNLPIFWNLHQNPTAFLGKKDEDNSNVLDFNVS